MRKPTAPHDSAPGPRSVSAQEVLSLREFGRWLGLGRQALCDAQRHGLPTVTVGRVKFVVGSQAVAWFTSQAQQQAATEQDGRAGDVH